VLVIAGDPLDAYGEFGLHGTDPTVSRAGASGGIPPYNPSPMTLQLPRGREGGAA
jgi:hypothetical protein